MEDFIHKHAKRPYISLGIGLVYQLHVASVLLHKLWRDVVLGPDEILPMAFMMFNFVIQLFWSDVHIKPEEFKYMFLLWMMEYFLYIMKVDFGDAIVDYFDVELFVDHYVFCLIILISMYF